MKMNNTISIALIALLTLGVGTAMAASTEASKMMKTDGMEKMDSEMKTETMEKMDSEMKTETMEKMDSEMKTETMDEMDGEMKTDHKKKAMMDS